MLFVLSLGIMPIALYGTFLAKGILSGAMGQGKVLGKFSGSMLRSKLLMILITFRRKNRRFS
jgi:hypothetical protein